MTYEEFVTKGQIERLGLRNTLFPSALSKIKQEAVEQNGNWHKQFLSESPYIHPTELATGYVETNGKLAPVPRSSQRALFSNGAILASAPDISLWDIGLAGGILVKEPANREIIYSGFKLADGTRYPANCGWRFTAHKGFMDITGNPPGFSVYLSRFTDKAELVCVTLCANKDGVNLTELARRIAGCFDARLGPPSDPASMTCLESSFSVNVTMGRLESYLNSQGAGIIARVNHTDAGKRVGLDLRPTETLIFGNPAAGTHLMISQQEVALDLSLRMAAWLDEKGSVWLGWHEPSLLAEQHNITDRAGGLGEDEGRA
jgi:D-alanyl-D-alanine carboxypeptidase